MSLLADLLSKVKSDSNSSREVPPHLKKVVDNAADRQRATKRMALLALFVAVALAAGFLSVIFLEKYLFIQPQQIVINRPADVKPAQHQPLPLPLQTKEPAQPAAGQIAPQIQTQPAVQQKPSQAAQAPDMPKEAKQIPSQPPAQQQKQKIQSPQTPKTEPAIPSEKPAKPVEQQAAPKKEAPASKPTLQASAGSYDTNSDIYLYTAKNHEARKEYRQAYENYKKALELSPKNFIIMSNISGTLIQMGSYSEAARYAKDSLNHKKDYLPSLINLGIAHIKSGNESEGEGYLSKVLSLDPANRYALLNIAILQENRKEYEKALSSFQKLSAGGSIQGWTGMARVFEKQGKLREAASVYREILSLDNAGPDAKKTANERLQLID